MIQINTLRNIAIGGFVACWGSYYLFQQTLSKALIKSEICKDAVELIKNHNGAKLFLGEPIEPLFAKFSREGQGSEKSVVQLFVSGPKSNGEVFLTINKNEESQPVLDSVHLQVGKDNMKRLEIKSSDQSILSPLALS